MPLPVAALAKRTLKAGDINAFLDVEARTEAAVPLMASPAECGLPSPAEDYVVRAAMDDAKRVVPLVVGNVAPIRLDTPGKSARGICLIPDFDGAFFTREWKEALWARFTMAAPRRQRQSVERYSIVKRA